MNQLYLYVMQQLMHRYRKAAQSHPAIDKTLDHQFTVERPNEVLCSDVTYVWAGRRWLYLDLYSRGCLGAITIA